MRCLYIPECVLVSITKKVKSQRNLYILHQAVYTIQVLLYKCTEVKIILVQASCVRVLATHTQSVNGGLHSVNPDQNIVQLVSLYRGAVLVDALPTTALQ